MEKRRPTCYSVANPLQFFATRATDLSPRGSRTRSVRDVETVFDAHVDPALVERSLAASTFGSMWLDIPRPEYPPLTGSRWSLDRADHAAGRRNVLLRTLDSLGLGFES